MEAGEKKKDDFKSHYFVFTAEKAGMSKIDKERVQRVVFEMSKNSAYYKNQERLDRKTEQRLVEMRAQLARLDRVALDAARQRVEKKELELEASRDLSRTWCVVDMDMFFAAVAMRDNPELRDKPIAVGGMSMISTANYEARKYGVRSAMPGFIARQLCPHLIFVKSDSAKYKAAAREFRAIFAQYDPDFSSMSLDEAKLDLTRFMDVAVRHARYHASCPDSCAYRAAAVTTTSGTGSSSDCTSVEGEASGDDPFLSAPVDVEAAVPPSQRYEPRVAHESGCRMAESVVAEMRARVRRRTQLTCSAGIAPTPMLAKIASDRNKPNGQFAVAPTRAAVLGFLADLPVRKVPGVGKVTERVLRGLGVDTVGQLRQRLPELSLLFYDKSSAFFLRAATGVTRTEREEEDDTGGLGRKSISCERTFRATGDRGELRERVQELCRSLAQQMDAKALQARTLTLKIKTADFRVRQRAHTFPTHTSDGSAMARVADELLDAELRCRESSGGGDAAGAATSATAGARVRLLGVRMHHFKGEDALQRAPGQAALDRFLAAPAGGGGGSGSGNGNEGTSTSGPQHDPLAVPATSERAATPPMSSQAISRTGGRPAGGLMAFLAPPQRQDGGDGADGGELTSPHSPCSAPARAQAAPRPDSVSMSVSVSPAPPAAVTREPARCPLCGLDVTGWLLLRLNQHVDQCLGMAPAPKRRRVGPAAAASAASAGSISSFFASARK